MRRDNNSVDITNKLNSGRRARALAQFSGALAFCLGLMLGAAAPAAAQTVATPVTPNGGSKGNVTLPGGATSLQETHDDWVVACSVVNDKKRCEFSQALGNKQTGKRILSIEFQPAGANIHGIILAPFGLRLADGVVLKVDDKPILGKLAFTTCVEAGCIVPVEVDAKTASVIASGNQMTFNAVNGGSGQAVTLNISLKGFTAARQRAAQLMR
jgi:invasion protein IalB